MLRKRSLEACARGANYLVAAQSVEGGFTTVVSYDQNDFSGASEQTTTFIVALVMGAIANYDGGEQFERLKASAARFLMQQQSVYGGFNYWPRGYEQAKAHPYPDDLDDTACALLALQLYRSELVTAEMLAAFVHLLTVCETQVGGPYRTWVVPDGADEVWRDVDVGVNSNIAFLLAQHEVVLPRLIELAEEAICTESYTTPYYSVSECPVVYFLSRFYQGEWSSVLRHHILARRDRHGWWGNAMDSALAVSALLNLEARPNEVEQALHLILEDEREDGWPARALYVERVERDRILYAGSSAVSTAFVMEALSKYHQALRRKQRAGRVKLTARSDQPLYQMVVTKVRDRFASLTGDLQSQAQAALDRMLERDQDRQIVLLPMVWEEALRPATESMSSEMLVDFGAASLYGWMSYTIYDDFLDNEGKPPLLPVANVALRELVMLLPRIMPTVGGEALVQGVIDRIEAANAWEVLHCRAVIRHGKLTLREIPDYGEYGMLADRSLGHALGPMGILLQRGCGINESAMQLTLKFFRHYLIARQLNDDAHDWEEDLLAGRVNAVGALLLRGVAAAEESLVEQPLEPLMVRLKRRLWEHEIVEVCELVSRHVAAARDALEQNPLLERAGGLVALLDPLEAAANEALQERARTLAFMRAYEKGRL